MSTLCRTRVASLALMIVAVSGSALVGQQNDERQREQIGEALGKPVYRDDIRTGNDFQLRDELHRLFTAAVMAEYCQEHKADITPTESEIASVTAYVDKKHRLRIQGKEAELREQLKAVEKKLASDELTNEVKQKLELEQLSLQSQLNPPGRDFALFLLGNWKLQRHLYDEYGGGRILWQQAGLEAFDAMHKWLQTHEKNGKFKITDPKLRTVFYEYWTTMNHGSFLFNDEKRIRHEFLEPEWLEK